MLPRIFYEEETQITQERTPIPTGVISDIKDFGTAEGAWLAVNIKPVDQIKKQKTLIFADRLFDYRAEDSKREIWRHLENLKKQGFNILIPKPDGELVPLSWPTYQEVPEAYLKALPQFSNEALHSLAENQKHLSAKKVLPLDFCRLNESLGKDPNEFDLSQFDFANHDMQEMFKKFMLETEGICTFKIINKEEFEKFVKLNIEKITNTMTFSVHEEMYSLLAEKFKIDLAKVKELIVKLHDHDVDVTFLSKFNQPGQTIAKNHL